jgi:hypothetical protein
LGELFSRAVDTFMPEAGCLRDKACVKKRSDRLQFRHYVASPGG